MIVIQTMRKLDRHDNSSAPWASQCERTNEMFESRNVCLLLFIYFHVYRNEIMSDVCAKSDDVIWSPSS